VLKSPIDELYDEDAFWYELFNVDNRSASEEEFVLTVVVRVPTDEFIEEDCV